MDGDLAPASGPDEPAFVAVSIDDLVAFRAAIVLAEEALQRARRAIERHEGAESHLAQEIGSALEALATTEADLRRAGAPDDRG